MELNSEVENQIILLASILGGFSLTTAVQIALDKEMTPRKRGVANDLTLCFTGCLIVIICGIIRMAATNPHIKNAIAAGMGIAFLLVFVRFLSAAHGLFSAPENAVIKDYLAATGIFTAITVAFIIFSYQLSVGSPTSPANRALMLTPTATVPVATPTVTSMSSTPMGSATPVVLE